MLTKQEQRSWIKIEDAGGRSGDAALPYRTVARWVSRRSGRPHVDNHTIQLVASLLDVDR
jgi:hypothetical protein